ncbi:hypothetical protein BK667_00580 [Pseudomonas frederiksbergensis]|nr:hypothetical protein BK667_00580 [Pseudomonas frederiksbergensis]
MIGTRLQKPVRKVEELPAGILPTTHSAHLKQAKKVVKLPADNNPATATACPEADRVRIAEGNLPTIKKTCPNQARKVARRQADNSPTSLINRPVVDAVATLPMTSHLTWGAKTVG